MLDTSKSWSATDVKFIRSLFWEIVTRLVVEHTEREIAIERSMHTHPAGKRRPNRTDQP